MNRFSVIADAPGFTKGKVKELRIRWALEEMDLAYEEIKVPHAQTKSKEYLKNQPFGQVPYFESDDITMFETGAILLHLAQKHKKLIPIKAAQKARVMSWLFASLNSIEPFIAQYFLISKFYKCEDKETVKKSFELASKKLGDLANALNGAIFLENEFSIADIAMTTVLRDAYSNGLLENFPSLINYKEQNEARPAFIRALSTHENLYN